MRAIAREGYGGRDRLTRVDLPIPEPGPEDVLVRVRAAGVGPWDAKTREGRFGTRRRTVGAWREPTEDRSQTRARRRRVRWQG
jgi:NADPH:quinone reductase-like Zn-dependent oxidoreductase